jgi:hypothetical protein
MEVQKESEKIKEQIGLDYLIKIFTPDTNTPNQETATTVVQPTVETQGSSTVVADEVDEGKKLALIALSTHILKTLKESPQKSYGLAELVKLTNNELKSIILAAQHLESEGKIRFGEEDKIYITPLGKVSIP